MDEERIAANKYKRPHYAIGDRIRITGDGPFQNQPATVTAVEVMQTITGIVVTYFYSVRLDNLSIQKWPEESIGPLV